MLYVDKPAYTGEAILLPRKGTLDAIMYVNGPFWTVDTIYWATVDNQKAYAKYLYSYLCLLDLSHKNQGTAVPSLTFESWYSIKIDLPSLEEQKRIGDLAFTFIEKMKTNRKMVRVMEDLLQFLYDYWFTQFDFPNADGKPYRASGGAMIHNDELGIDIPEGWEVKPLTGTSLFSVIKTGVTKFDGTKRYLATADVVGTAIGAGNPIEYATRESRANMEPTVLSVWFAKMKDTIKHLFISSNATDFVNGTILSTGFFGLQCTESSFEYVASYVSHPLFEKWKNHMAHGATQKAVNGNDLAKIKIIEPSVEVLERFHEIAEPLYQQMNGLQAENEQLVKLRDFLLPLLMSRQVTVKTDDENEEDAN